MYDGNNYDSYWHRILNAPTITGIEKQRQIRLQDARERALHTKQIKEIYHNSSKIADLVYIQGYGEFLLDKNDNLIKVQKEQDNEL